MGIQKKGVLHYHLFKLESSNFERDYLLIPTMFSKYPRMTLPVIEKYQEDNYNPNAGEFGVASVRLWEMFPLLSHTSNSGILGLAVLTPYLQALIGIDSKGEDRWSQPQHSRVSTPDELISWLKQNIDSMGQETRVGACQSITDADLNSYIVANSRKGGQIYFSQNARHNTG